MIRRTAVALLMVAASLVAAFGVAAREAEAQDDPVQFRLGGRSTDFTKKYGQPVQTVESDEIDDATFSTYEVFGFAEVSTTIYDGLVVGINLRPVLGDTWTEEAARVVLRDFAPADAEYDGRIDLGLDDLGVNRFGTPGTSEGIKDDVDDEIYDGIEADGDPGDFFVTMYEAVPSFYSALAIDLGATSESSNAPLATGDTTVVEESAPAVTQVGPTAEEQRYFDDVLPLLDLMSGSLGRFSDLMDTPRIGENDWTIGVAGELVTWQYVYDEALALVPPPSFAGVHSLLLVALGNYSDAADLIIYGLDNFDIGAIEQATILMQDGAVAIAEANAMLDSIREERDL